MKTRLVGYVALMTAHCAGMVDIVALPVWIGSLIQYRQLDPQQAGGLVTLFLSGAVLSSIWAASRLGRLKARWVAAGGYALASACFAALSQRLGYGAMAALHAGAGLAAGIALSVTHGTIARSAAPQRQFAVVGTALGIFAVAFMAVVPQWVARAGGDALFAAFGAVMLLASLVCAMGFPEPGRAASPARPAVSSRMEIPRAVWFGIAGVSVMAVVQSMTFSFLERVGHDRGYGAGAITAVLVALSLVNLLPAILAAVLEQRWCARRVLCRGPVLQALLAATIMCVPAFEAYALAASFLVAVMIFTHTFAFGLLARLEPTGRALAATPAMLMVGAAVGPVLGGTLIKAFGYPALGLAALCFGALALWCMSRLPQRETPAILITETP